MTVLPLLVILMGSPAASSPVQVVNEFYGLIVKHHPLGLPDGQVKDALAPFLSSRLAGVLADLQACEDDYFRRYRGVLEAEQLKPNIGWLEEGLFSGSNEEALPAEVVVTGLKPLPGQRLRADLEFTYREAFETYGRPPDPKNAFKWKGAAVLDHEAGRYVIDDFVGIDRETGRDESPLSRGFGECRDGKWRGDQPY